MPVIPVVVILAILRRPRQTTCLVTVYFFSDRDQFHRKNAKKQFAILPIVNNLPVRSQNGKGNM